MEVVDTRKVGSEGRAAAGHLSEERGPRQRDVAVQMGLVVKIDRVGGMGEVPNLLYEGSVALASVGVGCWCIPMHASR